MRIYLDYNAGAPVRREVKAALEDLLAADAANPSSVHTGGQLARKRLEHARRQVASMLDASPRQIVFTSGGTESNNLAIAGALRCRSDRRKIVSSATEHSSVIRPLQQFEREGYEILSIRPEADGHISPRA